MTERGAGAFGGHRPVAPIFKKRPRQALLAHPNKVARNDTFAGAQSDQGNCSNVFRPTANAQCNRGWNARPSNPAAARMPTSNPRFGASSTRPSFTSNTNIIRPPQNYNRPPLTTQHNKSSTYPAPGNKLQNHNNQQWSAPSQNNRMGSNISQGSAMGHKQSNSAGFGNNNVQGYRPSQQTLLPYGSVNNRPSSSSLSYADGNHQNQMTNYSNQTANRSNDFFSHQPHQQSTPAISHEQRDWNDGKFGASSNPAPQQGIMKTEESMRILTTSIKSLKHWSRYKQKAMIIFEVFGIMNSAVTLIDGSLTKEFIMKDNTDSITCKFYEIDRALPRLIRGKWYRCVGSLDREDKLHCVSVRPAMDTEIRLHANFLATSDRILKEIANKSREI